MGTSYTIRRAGADDLATLVAFAAHEACEAEGTETPPEGVRRGVETGLTDPRVATYWVAEMPDGEVVAAISVVTEWSNFHGGWYWWVQSLFIVPAHRGGGLVDLLLGHLRTAAEAAGALDLRLTVHEANRRAVRAYLRNGFSWSPYLIMVRPLGGS